MAPATGLKVLVLVHRGRGADARVLLLHRASPKPDEWQPVTGNVDPDEDLARAAERETREETGIDGRATALGLVHRFSKTQAWTSVRDWEEHAFALEAEADAVTLSHEHDASRWTRFADAVRVVAYDHQRAALSALSARLGA